MHICFEFFKYSIGFHDRNSEWFYATILIKVIAFSEIFYDCLETRQHSGEERTD